MRGGVDKARAGRRIRRPAARSSRRGFGYVGVTLAGSPQESDTRVRVGQTFLVADFESFTHEIEKAKRPDAGVGKRPAILHEDSAILVID